MRALRGGGELILARPDDAPYQELAERLQDVYIAGEYDEVARLSGPWSAVSTAAGDLVTTRRILSCHANALVQGGRTAEAIALLHDLLRGAGGDAPQEWRAKVLGILGLATADLGDYAGATAVLAEADWLVQNLPPGEGHLAASQSVALALWSVDLIEQAGERLKGIPRTGDPEVDVSTAHGLAVHAVFLGASLLLVGREDDARVLFVEALSLASRMRRYARLAGVDQLKARSLTVEAYALMHLGELPLAAARVEEGAAGFTAHPDLHESYLLQLVRAQVALADGGHDRAGALLGELIEHTSVPGREVWATTARVMLAEVHETVLGPHPAVDLWRSIGQTARRKVWVEREARFTAVQDQHRLRELRAETDRISQVVSQDALTGLGNRRLLEAALAAADGSQWAVFIDVDRFKSVNDTWSHAVGDLVLKTVADVLRGQARRSDVLVRYGGDEFVVLVDADRTAALALAGRVRLAVREHPWQTIAEGLHVTVSVGVGEGRAESLLARADAAMMTAKREGRDRVVSG